MTNKVKKAFVISARLFNCPVIRQEVWAFVDRHVATANVPRPIVLRDDSGATMGELWDSSLCHAHWETPEKIRAYMDLIGFDRPE